MIRLRDRLLAVLHLRCPACAKGRVFRGAFAMNERCPVCDFNFARGPGYYVGAMYFSYMLSIPLIAALTLLAYFIFPSWLLWQLVLLAWCASLPFVPLVFRYSRVCWLHFDQIFDPET